MIGMASYLKLVNNRCVLFALGYISQFEILIVFNIVLERKGKFLYSNNTLLPHDSQVM